MTQYQQKKKLHRKPQLQLIPVWFFVTSSLTDCWQYSSTACSLCYKLHINNENNKIDVRRLLFYFHSFDFDCCNKWQIFELNCSNTETNRTNNNFIENTTNWSNSVYFDCKSGSLIQTKGSRVTKKRNKPTIQVQIFPTIQRLFGYEDYKEHTHNETRKRET